MNFKMNLNQLQTTEYAPYFQRYIDQIDSTYTLIEELEIAVHRLIKFVQNIPLDKFDYQYAEGKWTIKDILQHLIDTERVFAYRALRIARNDTTLLPGFDENLFAEVAQSNTRSLQELLTELGVVRQATLCLFKSLKQEDFFKTGTASNQLISVRALGFLIIGHQNHHQRIFQERYL
jgi:uncharacterized damage-inducible protein DinB